MSESIGLGDDLRMWRAERPDEWTMDRFISAADAMTAENERLLEALETPVESAAEWKEYEVEQCVGTGRHQRWVKCGTHRMRRVEG